jgi:steroid delta-isomerase-like uncharacterized protein
MSIQDTSNTVRRFFAAIDGGDLDALDTLLAADFVAHSPGVPEPLDGAGVKGLFGGFRAAFPDLGHRIETTVAADDRVAVRLTIAGTHRAEFFGMPATGKTVTVSALNLFRFAGGRIAEQWVEYDTLGFLQQLGMAPVQAA